MGPGPAALKAAGPPATMRWHAVVFQVLGERLVRRLQHGRPIPSPSRSFLFPIACPSWQRRPKYTKEAIGALIARMRVGDVVLEAQFRRPNLRVR